MDYKDMGFITRPKRERPLVNRWKIRTEHPFKNCDKIHPLQQERVSYILDSVKDDENIESIVVFGSSVTERCHIESDVDLYFKLREKKKIHMPLCDFPFDLWTNFSVDSQLMNEIKRKGVIVYGNDGL